MKPVKYTLHAPRDPSSATVLVDALFVPPGARHPASIVRKKPHELTPCRWAELRARALVAGVRAASVLVLGHQRLLRGAGCGVMVKGWAGTSAGTSRSTS